MNKKIGIGFKCDSWDQYRYVKAIGLDMGWKYLHSFQEFSKSAVDSGDCNCIFFCN